MRLKENRNPGRGILALPIRALCVLAITLIAMASPPAGSASVPNCDGCPADAAYICVARCLAHNPCLLPRAVPSRCMQCYWSKCPDEAVECPVNPGPGRPDDGTRVECVLRAQDGVPWG